MEFDARAVIQTGQFTQARSLVLIIFATFFSAYVVPDDPRAFDYLDLVWQIYLIGIVALLGAWYSQIFFQFFARRYVDDGFMDDHGSDYGALVQAKVYQRNSRYTRFSDLLSTISIMSNVGFLGAMTYPAFRASFGV
ncbi:MAG: hypothetical protein WA790_20015 [Sulfitobacter sp.]